MLEERDFSLHPMWANKGLRARTWVAQCGVQYLSLEFMALPTAALKQ